jgi:diguanylate cyclase (GGDEF)-like protein/PAS domain S-box-containing protein
MHDDQIDFKFLAENSSDVICRAGKNRIVKYISPSCMTMFGRGRNEIEGGTMDHLTYADDMPKVLAAIEQSLHPGVHTKSNTFRMIRKDRSLVWVELNARIVRDDTTGELVEFVFTMRDITERKLLEEKLADLALKDGLTGIANRRAFDVALKCEWKRTLREGTEMSLLLLDIDHFKGFNDAHGHQVGDDCLRAVAEAAVGAVRQTDTVARYGGEEIAIILPRVDTQGAMEAAEKVRLAILRLRMTHEGNLEGGGWVSASIGAATALARHGGTMRMPESLLQAADHALYKAKREGRNRVEAGLLIAPMEAMRVKACD